LQVVCSPKEQTIKILSAEGRDKPFDKGMGPGNLGHRLHRFHVQDPQIGLPAVELEQRIMISTEPPGPTLPRDGLVGPGPTISKCAARTTTSIS